MAQIELFLDINNRAELVDQYSDTFSSPTCPELEQKYSILFDNLPVQKDGLFSNRFYTFARIRICTIQLANLWSLTEFDDTKMPVLEKNPYSQYTVKNRFGVHNGLTIIDNTIFAGVFVRQNSNFFVIRPVYGWFQDQFRDVLTKLFEFDAKK